MSPSEGSLDPNVDETISTTFHVLLIRAQEIVFQKRRLSLMDGSDCDDEDRVGRHYLGKRIEGELKSVPAIVFIWYGWIASWGSACYLF